MADVESAEGGSSMLLWLGLLAAAAIAAAAYFFIFSSPSKPKVQYARAPEPATKTGAAGAATGAKAGAAKPAETEDDSKLPLLRIYFGSQTGTGENYAKQLKAAGRKHGFRVVNVNLETFARGGKEAMLSTPGLAVFLMSTYGEGDPTDTAVDFTKWLKETSGDAARPATGLQYTVFGLGNRQYQFYNQMGKLTDSRLEEMGATRVYALGLGDDDGDLEADFEQWRDGLWPALQAAAGTVDASPSSAGGSGAGAGAIDSRRRGTSDGAGGDETELPDLPAFPWTVTPLPGPPAGVSASAAASGEPTAPAGTPVAAAAASRADMSARHFFQAVPVPVAVNRELRQATGVGASTRHVELDLAGSGVSYMTADNLYVLPENEPELVARVAAACGFDLDAWIGLEPAADGAGGDGTAPAPLFPAPVSVRTLLSRYVDLSGEPRKDLLGHLAHFAGAPAERARLLRLASRAGREEFTAWVRGCQRAVYELFDAFPSLKVPLAAFVHIMPRLQPRAYTIASSSLVQPSRVAIVASVLDAEKPGAETGRRLRGVCSNYLLRSAGAAGAAAAAAPVSRGSGAASPAAAASAAVSAAPSVPRMWVTVKPSTFRLPRDARTPVIMIGPGTGIAPFRGFLQERAHLRSLGKAVGPAFLYFGCQARDRDFVYREELDAWVRDGTLSGLYTAFSREQERKVYVQHLLAERGAEVAGLIVGQNASVYVCGATRMGHDVADALQAILSTHPGGGASAGAGAAGAEAAASAPMRAEEAKAYLTRMHAEARYVQELWSS